MTKLLWAGFALALITIMAAYALEGRAERLRAGAWQGAGFATDPADHYSEFREQLELRELGQE